MKPVVVYVVDYQRKYLVLRYTDPDSGKQVTKSSRTTSQKEALKAAAKWEAEINEGRYKHSARTSWDEFRIGHELEAVGGLAKATQDKYFTTLQLFETFARPTTLRGITTNIISRFLTHLRSQGASESTIGSHLAHLKAAIRWGVDNGFAPTAPKFPKVQRAERTAGTPMKGRPLTDLECEVMRFMALDDEWRFYLRGLWLSGLRLQESLDFWWDNPARLCVHLGECPMISIPSGLEKGRRTRLLPMTPDFAQFLLSVPEDQRTGRVFLRNFKKKPHHHYISHTISELGKQAGIIVSPEPLKYASAHDFRRSFGTRWASRVMPAVLQQLMRHQSITTTLRYYVGLDAAKIYSDLVALVGSSNKTTE